MRDRLRFFHPDATPPGSVDQGVMHEKNGVLLPVDHPLAKSKKLRLRDLAGTPFVMFPARTIRVLRPGAGGFPAAG